TKVVSRPYGYLLPASEERIAHQLLRHNLVVQQIEVPAELEVETFVVDRIGHTSSRDIAAEAPPETVFFGHRALERTTARPGDFLVLMAQPFACLAAYLLEPESDDGLVEWGFFPDVTPGSVYPVRRIAQPVAMSARPWIPASTGAGEA
ncbi:MAG TPA: hypothetical protein VNM87_06970, partial [Candidatus Udaeobacter sp.]|nr:hypothetical protein [Candidatus Udaeobacter sp.]